MTFAGLLLLAAAGIAHGQTEGSAGSPQLLDRVVAAVNYQPVLWSDVTSEVRLSVLDPDRANVTLTPQEALQLLISRKLIEQQIGQEDLSESQPSDQEVQARLNEMRKELPACVRMNCATDAGWQEFLKTNGLTADQVEKYVRLRMELLRFIEIRFRQGIRISREEIEAYYRDKLVPQYGKASEAPPLSAVSARIEEILLEQQVNVLFDNWLDNLRKQGDVEVLDSSLEAGHDSPAGSSQVE